MELNLACVIVTYNRLNYLKKALDCYDQQTKMPNYLIIVDNHSTDGTSDYLDGWKKKRHGFKCIILHLPENIGGSGGFYSGCQKALELGVDYIWMADDDAYPIMGPLSRPRSKILRVAVSRIILSSEASKVKLVGNLVA